MADALAALRLRLRRGISWRCRLQGASRIVLGHNVRVHPGAVIDCREDAFLGNGSLGESRVMLGDNTVIAPGAMVLPYGGEIVIGSNCTVNPYALLYGHGGLKVGNNTRIAAHAVLIPSDHVFADPSKPIFTQGIRKRGIVIGEDVWIAARATILDGVTLGRGCVVAAGAVVTRSFEPMQIIGGVPARVIGARDGHGTGPAASA